MAEFLAMIQVPRDRASPTQTLVELAAIGLRQVMASTSPRLRWSDLEPLSSSDVATVFLRWRRAIKVAVAEAEAETTGKAVAGDLSMVAWRLETSPDEGFFVLVRRPASDKAFSAWLRAASFDPEKLTAVQREGLRGVFERERESADRIVEDDGG